MALWLSKNATGGWTYGYGEYMKTLAQLAQVEAKYNQVVGALPGWIANAAEILRQQGEALLASKVGTLTQYTKMPTYYLWIKGPDGGKFIGGEWNLLTGGAKAMQSYFSSVFQPAIQSTMLTLATAPAITAASKAAVGVWNPSSSPARLKEEARKAEGAGVGVGTGEGGASAGFMLPLLLGGALVLFLALKR